MSKSELKYKLKSEISTINRVIDQKILRGLPYDREARYHKNLLKRLEVVHRSSLLARSMRSFAMTMF
jgi:hypothetical protein